MEQGRYAPQQGWDNNSALEGYGAGSEPDYRSGGLYNDRRSDGFPRDTYGRDGFHQDARGKEMYQQPPGVQGMWAQPRRNYDDDYGLARDHRRHESFHDIHSFRGTDRYNDTNRTTDNYHEVDNYHDYGFERHGRFGSKDHDEFDGPYDDRFRGLPQSRESSHEKGYDFGRSSYDSDYERGRRDNNKRRRDSRGRSRERRGSSRERDESPYMQHDRSWSRGHDDRSRSRSPHGRSRGRSHREDSYDDDDRYERSDRRREHEWDERKHVASVAPSATVVVKGLSLKTTDEDLYQMLAEWGPLRHVRVIKERSSGTSRGFAFIDFPTVETARKMMDSLRDNAPVLDGRKLFFEYSSKPTGGNAGSSLGHENFVKSGYGHRTTSAPCDWICTICGCMNFARRTFCFQCNEPRTEDAPPADTANSGPLAGRRGAELGPTHVLVVRGLDENADEEMLRYEFAKHAPVKDIRLVRDKFTHVSRGFAFVHFHSVEAATKALDATNGTTLEKNGQVLRVAYAKSIHGPVSGGSQSSSLAAAAIEAATFAQQYDNVGWAPKEYNPDEKQPKVAQAQGVGSSTQAGGAAPQAGFVWDEKSGYYYDAASGFYYDGNSGLYYDGNAGIWYYFDQQSQQYVPCNDTGNKSTTQSADDSTKVSGAGNSKKVVISAPASTSKSSEQSSVHEAVQAAANAALAAEKKEKEKMKEIKLASKSSLLANKKKMNNVLALWKQRNQEGQAPRVVLDDKEAALDDDRFPSNYAAGGSMRNKGKSELSSKEIPLANPQNSARINGTSATQISSSDVKPQPVSNSFGGTIMGVIRSSSRGVVNPESTFPASSGVGTADSTTVNAIPSGSFASNAEASLSTPFKTDASALGSYGSSGVISSGKRRFSEAPALSVRKEQSQSMYRDRAAERRSLYGSSTVESDVSEHDSAYQKSSLSERGSMPFPPGVGGRSVTESSDIENYEVITADRAIDESNVGNRLLRNMGWKEGLGLGKDASGIKEPVQAKSSEVRAGLGSQQRKPADPLLEAQAGDSYRMIIQKKAIARFREMNAE